MTTFHNRTRTSRSIPRRLWSERRPYLIPVYYLLLASELGREGIRNSGSYQFADHIYGGRARGEFGLGRMLDALLLRLPAARAMRARYAYARSEISRFVAARVNGPAQDVLCVPSGLARELFDVAAEVKHHPSRFPRVRWHAMDLDAGLAERLAFRARELGIDFRFTAADALSPSSYPEHYDLVVSLGLGEFLNDDDLLRFYRTVHARLKSEGVFITSGMRPQKLADFLMRNIAELHTHYRSQDELVDLAAEAGFTVSRAYADRTGLQTMLVLRS